MNWTDEQKQVIDSRNCNLLVSAAAGSGKTAVLVERIIGIITDDKNPVDLDRLLVMTFTNAAAAEMRERIGNAILKKLETDPENEHLQRQSALIHNAKITTIHSFCLSLIREHFNEIDIDPSFRIGDEGELMLLKADVMETLLEEEYEKNDKNFADFVDAYAVGKADGGIADYIMQVYTFSQSNPWPEKWFGDCRQELNGDSAESILQTGWMQFLMRDVQIQIREWCEQYEEIICVSEEEGGPGAYTGTLKEELECLEELAQTRDYKELSQSLSALKFGRLPQAKKDEVDPEKKSYVTSIRDLVKKKAGKLKEAYCYGSLEEMIGDMKKTAVVVDTLLGLAERFSIKYQEQKKEKNLVDFNDLEHFALKLLDHTPLADELANWYHEILIDEYQDSNSVQETLVRSLSAERFGRPDVFMVGDVKQSIYKFRLAKPEIFMEKYESYQTEESSKNRKIELQKNFRSRAVVLEFVNSIFYKIMKKSLGNIEYTKETALNPAAIFPECDLETASDRKENLVTELLLTDTKSELLENMDADALEFTTHEVEAKLISERIKKLVEKKTGLLVYDVKQEKYRRAQYRDIVILLRSPSGFTEDFLKVLQSEGIPAYAESRTGYFSTIEVETVLSFLAVIDNPIQDIPLAAVMRSPFAGVTDEDMAVIISQNNTGGLYEAWISYVENVENQESPVWKRLNDLKQLVDEFRKKTVYMTVRELIEEVYRVTGYYDYISAMPAGQTRRANLDMLVQRAAAYETTSYKGLFNFIRYIEKLKKYQTDFGEASILGENENAVRIMSIHKSKGLEFPIVFLSGLGKLFNRTDQRSKLIIDSDYGIACDVMDVDLRIKGTTIKKNVLKQRIEQESLGEELRVLYVAMTRAKEKLILTAADKNIDKKMQKWSAFNQSGNLNFSTISSANSYLDWILMCVDLEAVNQEKNNFAIMIRPLAELIDQEVERQEKKNRLCSELLTRIQNMADDSEYRKMLREILGFQYPYEEETKMKAKLSVSEMKKQSQQPDENDTVLYQPYDQDRQSGKNSALRGTAYHKIMELMPFDRVETVDDVKLQMEKMLEEERISKEYYDFVDPKEIELFLKTELGRKMKRAAEQKKLYREQQFVMGVRADELGVAKSEELILIQGIIDAYIENHGKLLLIDYKTDFVKEGQEQVLVDHYKKQLELYETALKQITGKEVEQKVIYSFTLKKEIVV